MSFFERRDVHAASRVGFGIFLFEPRGDPDELDLGGFDTRAWTKASDRADKTAVTDGARALELVERVKCRLALGMGLGVTIALGQDADDVMDHRIDLDRFAHDRRPATKAALPKGMRQQHRRGRVLDVVFRCEKATELRSNPKRFEETRGDVRAGDPLGLAVTGDREEADPTMRPHRSDGLALGLKVIEVRGRDIAKLSGIEVVRPGDDEESKVDARETVPPSRRLRA